MTHAHIFRPGMTAEEAVACLVEHSNTGPDVLFLTDGWFAPYRRKLLVLLPDRITTDQAAAFVDILYKRRKLDAMVAWLEHQPHPWSDVDALLARLGRERLEAIREQGFFPWDDVDACRGDAQQHLQTQAASGPPDPEGLRELDGCHGCGRQAPHLEWLYFSSPAWTWKQLCGRAGWMAICPDCRYQIHFFGDVMN